MSDTRSEIIHVHAMRLDDLGLAEDTAARALVFLRKGVNVEVRFAARTMQRGFAERLLAKLAIGESWVSRATARFAGDPDLLAVLRSAREDRPDIDRWMNAHSFGVGTPAPVEREVKPKQKPKGGA